MEYTGQELQHGISPTEIKKGDLLVFVNFPKFGEPRKVNYATVEHANPNKWRGLKIGKILSNPTSIGGYYSFYTDLQTDEVAVRNDLLVTKATA